MSFEQFVKKTPLSTGFITHGRRGYQKDEELIVRRRNAECERQQLWTGVNDYFKTWNVRNNKFADWSSPEFYNLSTEKQIKEIEAQKAKENLKERRKRLLELLRAEDQQYHNELKNLRKHNRNTSTLVRSSNDLCFMNLEIKRREDEAARRDRELKLYHHYNPTLRPYNQMQRDYFTNTCWNEENKENVVKTGGKNFKPFDNSFDRASDKSLLRSEAEILKSENIKLRTEIEILLKDLEKKNEKLDTLKSEEIAVKEKISKIKNDFKQRISNEDQVHDNMIRLPSSAAYVEEWKKKLKVILDEIKSEIEFLDDVIDMADSIKEYPLKFEAVNARRSFATKFRTESGREHVSKLFETPFSSRDPWMWFKEECDMWINDKEARRKILTDIYSKIETIEEKWEYSNLEDQQTTVAALDSILSNLEKLKDNIEKNDKLLSELSQTSK